MNAEPERKPRKNDRIFAERTRLQQEDALDDALENTFPASDPISIEQPIHLPRISSAAISVRFPPEEE